MRRGAPKAPRRLQVASLEVGDEEGCAIGPSSDGVVEMRDVGEGDQNTGLAAADRGDGSNVLQHDGRCRKHQLHLQDPVARLLGVVELNMQGRRQALWGGSVDVDVLGGEEFAGGLG